MKKVVRKGAGSGNSRKAIAAREDVLNTLRMHRPNTKLGTYAAELLLSVAYVDDQFGGYQQLHDVRLAGLDFAFFTEHQERALKESAGLILAKLVGGANDNAAAAVSAFGFDLDNTLSREEAQRLAEAAGDAITLYTTYNHGRSNQKLSDKHVAAIMKHRNDNSRTPLSDQHAQDYCASVPKFSTLKNVRVMHGGEIQNANEDPHWEIEHDPEVKLRVIIWLRTPIPISEVGQNGYRRLYCALGDMIFGAGNYDLSCQNPSRIFWLPSKPIGSTVTHYIEFLPGELFDWRPLWETLKAGMLAERERARIKAEARKKECESVGNLKKVAECLQHIPADLSRRGWLKGIAAIHYESSGSDEGLRLAHEWSAQAPELYDENEVDRLWEYFDKSADGSGEKATMGTLVHLVRQFVPEFRLGSKRRAKPAIPSTTPKAPIVVPDWRKHVKASVSK